MIFLFSFFHRAVPLLLRAVWFSEGEDGQQTANRRRLPRDSPGYAHGRLGRRAPPPLRGGRRAAARFLHLRHERQRRQHLLFLPEY